MKAIIIPIVTGTVIFYLIMSFMQWDWLWFKYIAEAHWLARAGGLWGYAVCITLGFLIYGAIDND
jgi:uncharacterized membrane protein YdcZ (DUF606 family)